MRLILLVAVLATGCGAVVGGHEYDALPEVHPPRADEAEAFALAAFEREIGEPMPPMLIVWVAESIPFGDSTVIGIHRSCNAWVKWWEGPRFHQLALAHEIGHCARSVLGLDTDPEHLDEAWWARDGAGIVDRVNRQLAGAGL